MIMKETKEMRLERLKLSKSTTTRVVKSKKIYDRKKDKSKNFRDEN